VVVESELGSLAFLGLYAFAGVAGGAGHVPVDLNSTVPLVGASGAISASWRWPASFRPVAAQVRQPSWGLNIWKRRDGATRAASRSVVTSAASSLASWSSSSCGRRAAKRSRPRSALLPVTRRVGRRERFGR
jgi:hypothetical protein